MATQLIIPRQLDANGDAASGAKALVYETGTTTPVTVYTDTGLSVAHASPIVADSAGYFAQAFYGGSTAIKVVVTDSADATLVTYDPVPLVSLSNSAAADVSFAPTTEITSTTVQAALVEVEATIGTTSGTEDSAITTAKIADDAVTDAKVLHPAGMVLIESQDASASASLDFTGFDETIYDSYMFVLKNLIPSSAGALTIRTSSDGGSTYDSGATDYGFGVEGVEFSTGTSLAQNDATFASIPLPNTAVAIAGDGVSGTITIYGPHLAKDTRISYDLVGENGNGGFMVKGGGQRNSAAEVDAVQFAYSVTITSGTITMYGLRNS